MRTALVLALCLIIALPTAQAATHTVTTMATGDSSAPFAFQPQTLTIAVGDTVRWVNGDGTYHTTTSRGEDGAANGDLWQGILGSEGATYEHTFDEVGTFPYFCQPHASFMEGTIVVTEADTGGDDESGGNRGAPGFSPIALVVALCVAVLVRRR